MLLLICLACIGGAERADKQSTPKSRHVREWDASKSQQLGSPAVVARPATSMLSLTSRGTQNREGSALVPLARMAASSASSCLALCRDREEGGGVHACKRGGDLANFET